MVDPLVWMSAACLALDDENVAELAMEWQRPAGESMEILTIEVRKKVRHFEVMTQEGD